MKHVITLLLLALSVGQASAQRISRTYQDVSLSEALKDLNNATRRYQVNFIYNELEDFRVTTTIHRSTLPEAVYQVVGFYPMHVTVGDSLVTVECTHKTDRHLTGRLIDEKNEPIAYANVQLLNLADSSLIDGGVSNENGDFVIPTEAHLGILKCSFVGYKTVWKKCEVGNIGTIQMKPAEYIINGVTIEGTHIMNYVDKSVHTFSDEQIKLARNVRDLLEHVEDLKIDPVSNTIKRIDGGNVKILLNGVNASDIDLKGIPAHKITRVEYYNIPPARYADAGTVINVITKQMENGVNAGIEARAAFTTGFTDDLPYLNLTSGNHQLSLSYRFSLREYTKRFSEDTYDYLINGQQTRYYRKMHDKFGYTWSDPVIKYTYNKPDDITVQVVATPHFDTYHNDGECDISIHSAISDIQGKGTNSSHDKSFGPNLNLYLQKTLPKNQMLDIDLVGTYYHTKVNYENEQIDTSDGSILLTDATKQKNDKYSFIGELAYTKKWEKGALSLGYRGTFGKSKATISNVLSNYQDYDYTSASYKHYMYAEYSGSVKKLMYRIGAGATQVTQDNSDTHDSRWLFTPKLILSTNLSKTMSLQWVTSSNSQVPTISQLSNNARLVIPSVISVGNPYLKSYNTYQTQLTHRWNLGWLNTQLSLVYSYADSPVNNYYTEQTINGQHYIVGMSENANFASNLGGSYMLTVKPFKNEVLTLTLQGSVLHQTVSSPIIGRYNHIWAPFYYSIDFRKGCWGALYRGGIVSKFLNGSFLSAGENQSTLQVFWQKKGWRIYASDVFFLTRARYSGYSLPTSILQYRSKTWIDDNKSMFVLGFSYDFSSGKNLNINRKLQNKDSDNGSF